MSEMNKEMLEIIDKNLAKNVGDLLKQRLQQAEENETALNKLKEVNEKYVKELAESNKQIADLLNLKQSYHNLEVKEKAFKDELSKFEIEKLKYQLEAEKDKSNFAKSIGLGLVRNLEYRNSVYTNQNISGHSTPQGWVDGKSISNSFDENKTIE